MRIQILKDGARYIEPSTGVTHRPLRSCDGTVHTCKAGELRNVEDDQAAKLIAAKEAEPEAQAEPPPTEPDEPPPPTEEPQSVHAYAEPEPTEPEPAARKHSAPKGKSHG